jgi:biotin carboxylase
LLANAAAGICEILWVIDSSEPGGGDDSRLLTKIGPVVDVAGLDPETAAAQVRRERPEGLTVFYDEKIILASQLADALDLPFYSTETARNLANKLAQRRALASKGVPCPRFWELPATLAGREIEVFAEQISYPTVLKPQSGAGSQGTHLIEDAASLLSAWGEEKRRGDAIVEEYLVGIPGDFGGQLAPYVSVESIVSRGVVSPLAVTGRFPIVEGFRETGFFIPSALGPAQQQEVIDVSTRSLRALGVEHGFANVEIKLTPGGPRVVEVNGRPGGGTPAVLELASGVALLPLVFRLALGEHIAFDRLLACPQIGYLFYRQPPREARTVERIEGLKELAAHPGVTSVALKKKVGDPVDWRIGITGYVFAAEGTAGNTAELLDAYRTTQEDVKIVFGH